MTIYIESEKIILEVCMVIQLTVVLEISVGFSDGYEPQSKVVSEQVFHNPRINLLGDFICSEVEKIRKREKSEKVLSICHTILPE